MTPLLNSNMINGSSPTFAQKLSVTKPSLTSHIPRFVHPESHNDSYNIDYQLMLENLKNSEILSPLLSAKKRPTHPPLSLLLKPTSKNSSAFGFNPLLSAYRNPALNIEDFIAEKTLSSSTA